MKLRRVRYWIADGWPIRLWFGFIFIGTPGGFGYVAFTLFSDVFEPLSGGWALIQFLFYVAVSVLMGLLVGLLAGMVVGLPVAWLYMFVGGRFNGAPFQQGDRVRILSRPNRDLLGRVINDSKLDSVEVEIEEVGDKHRSETFSACELIRET